MKLTIVHEEENLLAVRVQEVAASYINAVRRYASSRVPTMAIDFVEFKDNSGILYDEMVAHRMGLIPLTTDLQTYRLPEGEWSEPTGDARVEVQLTLSVTSGKTPVVVTAKDFVCKDKKTQPVHPDMPITKLIEGQTIQCVATARLGVGEEHAKYSPGHIYYKHTPHITITKQPKNAEEIAEKYPRVFEIKNKKLAVREEAAYHYPDTELGVEEINVEFIDGDYILIIESWGQLPPKTILEQAMQAYDDQLDAFSKLKLK
ncbi:MAG: DNA-directed RNA polymerase subunit D [Candidatus Woesearchaeota archaeon]